MLSRKQYIQSLGGTCKNWFWSWSFVNHEEQEVYFGAWANVEGVVPGVILSDDWKLNKDGKVRPGYTQARDHIRLVEQSAYVLLVYQMYAVTKEGAKLAPQPPVIDYFETTLHQCDLQRTTDGWVASFR